MKIALADDFKPPSDTMLLRISVSRGNCAFLEGSLDGGRNWYIIASVREGVVATNLVGSQRLTLVHEFEEY